MRTTTNKWHYTDQDELTARINNAEIAQRQEKNEEEQKVKNWHLSVSVNPKEDETVKRIDAAANPRVDNTNIRQQAVLKDVKKIREQEDGYRSKEEKELAKTVQDIQGMEQTDRLNREWEQQHRIAQDYLEKSQKLLQQLLAK